MVVIPLGWNLAHQYPIEQYSSHPWILIKHITQQNITKLTNGVKALERGSLKLIFLRVETCEDLFI